MAPKKDETEEKLTKLIKSTFEDLFTERDKKRRSDSESKEQQWLRQAIREEVAGFFEAFEKGLLEGKEKETPEGEEGEEGEGVIAKLFRSGSR